SHNLQTTARAGPFPCDPREAVIESNGMKKAALLAAVLASLGVIVFLSSPDLPPAQRLASLVPATVGPWLSEAEEIYGPGPIFDRIDGAGEIYRPSNMKLRLARRFHKDGRPDIAVDAYDMGSPEDASGVFTRELDGEDAGIGQGSSYRAGLLSFWKDRYFVSVYAEEETSETRAAVLELGREIAAAIPGQGELGGPVPPRR
ncbi:MAG TPA: DUF6599 family protein, partial [Acidobacteriota bacterium]|nr:DUF6599 family protein [Acidobacteriota bacterium]